MNLFSFKLKKIAAAAAAVVISVSMLGFGNGLTGTDGGAAINGYAAESVDELDRQLEEIEREKQELDKKIAAAGNDIADRQELIKAVNEKNAAAKKKIAKVKERSEQIEIEMCELDKKLRDTRYKLEQSEKAAREQLDLYKERLRTIYVAGSASYSNVLVNADSFYDVLMRVELLERVARHDSGTVKELLDRKNEIETINQNLLNESKALKAKSAEYASKLKELREERKELKALKEKYGIELDDMQNDLGGYYDMASGLDDEYGRVSDKKSAKTQKQETAAAAETKRAAVAVIRGQNADNTKKSKTKTVTVTLPKETEAETEPITTTTKKKKKKKTTTTAEELYFEPEYTDEYIVDDTPEYEPETTTTTTTAATTTTTTTQAYEDSYDDYYEQPQDSGYTSGANGSREDKINTVIEYALGMVGGSYVWAGEQYGATDCSGLVMLSYAQVGINLPHLASSQAEYGTDVSYSNIQPGDLVFFGNSDYYSSIYHVAMYIGNGRIVHAESSDTGIVTSYLDSVAQYNHVTCIKRLL